MPRFLYNDPKVLIYILQVLDCICHLIKAIIDSWFFYKGHAAVLLYQWKPGYLIAEIIVHYCIIMFYVYEGIQTYINQHVPAELPQSLFRFF